MINKTVKIHCDKCQWEVKKNEIREGGQRQVTVKLDKNHLGGEVGSDGSGLRENRLNVAETVSE